MNTHTKAYKCNHTQPTICKYISPKEMAHLSWDIPNRLISLLRKLSVQGLAWDLVWSSWRGTLKMSHLLWRGALRGRGSQGSGPLVCHRDAALTPLYYYGEPSALRLKVVMAPEGWLWGVKEETNKRNCPPNWGFLITSSWVIKLEIYEVHVHFFLFKLIYEYWSGLPGCFLRKYVNYYCLYPGNLLTILNTMKKPILLHSVTCKRS